MTKIGAILATAALWSLGCGAPEDDGGSVNEARETLEATLTAATPAPVVVGTGTAASCTEAAFVAALAAGGTVTFNCGGPMTIALTSAKTVGNAVTVDGGHKITFDGGNLNGLFIVSAAGTLVLQNLTLVNGNSNQADGGAIANHGRLRVTNCSVAHSSTLTGHSGGAIFSDGPFISIIGSSFVGNTSDVGGAIAIKAATTASITTSHFSQNTALLYLEGGGGVWVGPGVHVTIKDTTFSSNSAAQGGALSASTGAVVSVSGSATAPGATTAMVFDQNGATSVGGAIFNAGAMTVDNVLFSANQQQPYGPVAGGGAIYTSGALTLTGSTLSSNRATSGGGIFVAVGSATIDRTVLEFNNASGVGGGIFVWGPLNSSSPTLSVTRSSFDSNRAGYLGGGLAGVDASLSIEASSFTSNFATNLGGGLYIGMDSFATAAPIVVVEDVTVAQNGAPQGAGVFNDGVILQLSSTTIVHNWVDGVFTRRGGSTHLRSSVLQNPTNCGVDAATIIDDLANFATDLTCWLGPGSTQGVAADPRLGSPAQDPHGLTVYYPPLLFSPLVDRGFQCPPLDQIGNARSGPCDIGAIEGSDTIIIFK